MCLQELAKNQKLQRDLIEEIRKSLSCAQILKDIPQLINSMRLLEATVLETLRLWPSVEFGTMTCTKDCTIATDDGELFLFKKNDFIQLPFKLMQNDATNFESPEKFNPHRFIDDESKKSFLTHNRSTQSFVVLQAKLFIFKILQEYRIANLSGNLSATQFNFVRHL